LYGNFSLYVWLGTCDFTSKNKKYISLVHDQQSNSYKTIQQFEELNTLVKDIGFNVTFLEIPVYSIVEYNRSKGHISPEDFCDEDEQLQEILLNVNYKICILNSANHITSPKFSLDLAKSEK